MSTSNKINGSPDLQHRDWLLRTTIKQLLSIDQNITWNIISGPYDSRHLVLSDISEETLSKLFFYTNTDVNNNYLYLESFDIYINDSLHPLKIPGLTSLAIELWNYSDANSFNNNYKTFNPFDKNLINPCNGSNINISTWIDIYTAAVPFLPDTKNKKKMFRIVINPDCSANGLIVGTNGPCCSGFVAPDTFTCANPSIY